MFFANLRMDSFWASFQPLLMLTLTDLIRQLADFAAVLLHRRVSNLERPCSGPASSGPVKLRHGVLECPARYPPWLSVAFGLRCTFPGSPSLFKAVDHATLRQRGRRSSKHDQARCVHRRGFLMSRLGKIII